MSVRSIRKIFFACRLYLLEKAMNGVIIGFIREVGQAWEVVARSKGSRNGHSAIREALLVGEAGER